MVVVKIELRYCISAPKFLYIDTLLSLCKDELTYIYFYFFRKYRGDIGSCSFGGWLWQHERKGLLAGEELVVELLGQRRLHTDGAEGRQLRCAAGAHLSRYGLIIIAHQVFFFK